MTRVELHELGALIGPLSDAINHLTSEQRTSILEALLMLEICKLPPSYRPDELARIIADLPGCLRSTEEGMRIGLAENARGEG